MVTTMKQKVTRGAKWLDKNYKGWARKVKITRLNLANHCYCILGQLYGEYKTGLHILHKKRNMEEVVFVRFQRCCWL